MATGRPNLKGLLAETIRMPTRIPMQTSGTTARVKPSPIGSTRRPTPSFAFPFLPLFPPHSCQIIGLRKLPYTAPPPPAHGTSADAAMVIVYGSISSGDDSVVRVPAAPAPKSTRPLTTRSVVAGHKARLSPSGKSSCHLPHVPPALLLSASSSAVIMRNLVSALRARQHCKILSTAGMTGARFYIITAGLT